MAKKAAYYISSSKFHFLSWINNDIIDSDIKTTISMGILYVYSNKCQKCSNYYTIAFTSHTSKVMLKILQARLQQ